MQSFDPYKSATALGITEQERQGLIGLARDLSSPDYSERFDMSGWGFCAHAKLCAKIGENVNPQGSMFRLFLGLEPYWIADSRALSSRTPLEASEAIYRFLQDGVDRASDASPY